MPDIEQILRSRVKELCAEIRLILLNDALRIEAQTNKWLQAIPKPLCRTHFQSNVLKEISRRNQDKIYQHKKTLLEATALPKQWRRTPQEQTETQTVVMLRSKNLPTKIKPHKYQRLIVLFLTYPHLSQILSNQAHPQRGQADFIYSHPHIGQCALVFVIGLTWPGPHAHPLRLNTVNTSIIFNIP